MAYITMVRVEGFQSHVNSTFTLSPGLNVITGPSDAGKTAIIRALRWLAFNEPQGEAFIHTIRDGDGNIVQAADFARVTVGFDNGVAITKTRRKGKTVYTHSEYRDPWEKADLPEEIKSALGLVKQHYGDNLETCLNFAFQLDPPFMLSETGSTGAKVLGKLAGTEVVDKSIGVIVKQTHHTRDTIRQAEKAIGQYDVELLDYLSTEEKLQTVETLFTQFDDILKAVELHDTLNDLGVAYSTWTIKRDDALVTVERLANVPTLIEVLDGIRSTYANVLALKDKATVFWGAVKRHTDLTGTVKALKCVPQLQADLAAVSVKYDRLTLLKVVSDKQNGAKKALKSLADILNKLSDIEGLNADLGEVQAKADRLAQLIAIKNTLGRRKMAVVLAEKRVDLVTQNYDDAVTELSDAWSAAGGVCPLCGQPLEGVKQCLH